MKYLLLTIGLFISIFLVAQKVYQPLSATSSSSAVLQAVNKRFQSDLTKLPKKHTKDFKEIYQKRYDNLVRNIKRGLYLEDKTVHNYFNTILQNIINANTDIPFRDIRLLISRSAIPNASCIGEGTLVLNLGLITRLENESQIAFVICHELAHYKRNHVNKAIRKHVNTMNSKKTQKELKRLSKLEFNKYEKGMALLKTLTYDSKRHSRLHEVEADSIGLFYMMKTSYDVSEAVRCLEILDEIDSDKYNYPTDLKKYFNATEYPFKARWLKKETFITMDDSSNESEFNSDSLKTHPDCQKRIISVKRQLKGKSTGNRKKALQSEQWLADFILDSDYEIVERSYRSGNLGYCFYYTLQLLELYPDDIYLNTIIGKCLNAYRLARLNHEGSNYVPPASNDDSDDAYNQIVLFLNNLRTRDIAKLGYYFMANKNPKFLKEETFLYYLYLHAKAAKKIEQTQQLVAQYNQQFPEGKYKDEVKVPK